MRDDSLITLHGQPFLLYGQIDTAQPLKRDPRVPMVRTPGIDSPHDGDVVPSPFLLLGSASASQNQPSRIAVAALVSGALVVAEQLPGKTDRPDTVDFTNTLTLDPGRYRATLSGIDREPHEITITVVRWAGATSFPTEPSRPTKDRAPAVKACGDIGRQRRLLDASSNAAGWPQPPSQVR